MAFCLKTRALEFCTWSLALSFGSLALASQFGVPFPSHRFPTDTSFHATLSLGKGSTSSNYDPTGEAITLPNLQKVGWLKNAVQIEYQPSNHFSFGANFNFQRISLSDDAGFSPSAGWSLGDQSIFAEYRFLDGRGYSLGVSGVLKFPGYQNPTYLEAGPNGYALLPGDAQTDVGGMVSGEFWPASMVRLQGDFGYLFRTQGFSDQLIYQGSLGFAIPRVDFSLRMMGFVSIGPGPTPGSDFETDLTSVQSEFGGSMYSYSPTPTLMLMSPKVEFWINPEYALTATYTRTLMGSKAARGSYMEIGFIYRFVERKSNTRRRFTEASIDTDQDAGVFEGEIQEQNRKNGKPQRPQPPRTDFDFEPLYYESPE